MGTKMAPTYAILVMGFLEKQLYQRIEEKYGEATKTEFIKNFKRFLDDCFIFWQKSRAEVDILFNMHAQQHQPKNSFHNGIQLRITPIFRHTDL